MNPVFVRAELSDMEILLEMQQDFYVHEHIAFDPTTARHALTQILSNPHFGRVFLVHSDNVIAGYTVLTFGFSLEFHGRNAIVDELYLRADYRGRGIGRHALDFLADVCREEGIAALHLEVEDDNHIAHELYRKAGFADHARHLMTRWIAAEKSPNH